VKLYVEGGGDGKDQHTAVAKAFSKFFENAAISRRPRVVVRGGNRQAWDGYQSAKSRNESAALLIDSEAAFHGGSVRDFLIAQGFAVNDSHQDDELHLMVRCMEAWLLADRTALAAYFDKGFNENVLPSPNVVTTQSPSELEAALKRASRNTTKGEYDKGQHSWDLLARMNPNHIDQARSFLDWLRSLT
jgi:S-formylglutathione hydrolase FrmB